MKQLFLIICFSFLLCNCSTDNFNETKFLDLYSEILTIRTQEIDTSIANSKIQELFITHNYPEEKFRADFIDKCSNHKDEAFIKKIDSMRQSIYNNRIINN